MNGRRTTASKRQGLGKVPSHAKLDAMIEEAIVDAYGESEQRVGFFTMLEDNLATPFQAEVLGVKVAVDKFDMTDDEQIVAVCSKGMSRRRLPILDLPLPSPPPAGTQRVEAFPRWAGGGR